MDRIKARAYDKALRHLQTARSLVLFAGALALFACSTQTPRSPSANAPSVAETHTTRAFTRGAEVAADLTAQYQDKRADCGTQNRPAFLCSGVLFRGTQASTAYHSWNPSPGSQTRGGVSFSFLRADSKFNRLAYDYRNGLIFKPYQLAEAGKLDPEVLCVFPVDGWTAERNDQGCGTHGTFPVESRPCQAQGITTASQWVAHFNLTSGNKNTHQCGFDVRENGSGGAAYFAAGLAARLLIPTESFVQTNELVLATWAQMENPTPLPIQAFFYLPGGLPGAQHDQKDYFDQAQAVIPIIAMTLPTTSANDATFSYDEKDQVVGEPGSPASWEDFENVSEQTFAPGTITNLAKVRVVTETGAAAVERSTIPGLNKSFRVYGQTRLELFLDADEGSQETLTVDVYSSNGAVKVLASWVGPGLPTEERSGGNGKIDTFSFGKKGGLLPRNLTIYSSSDSSITYVDNIKVGSP